MTSNWLVYDYTVRCDMKDVWLHIDTQVLTPLRKQEGAVFMALVERSSTVWGSITSRNVSHSVIRLAVQNALDSVSLGSLDNQSGLD